LKVKGELEKNMRFPNEVALKKKKLNIFKIGRLWYFKCFFEDKEIFRDLLEYYNREKYKFEFSSVGERNKIMKDLVSVEEALEKGAEMVV
jgi:hypothetical protein